MSEIIVEPILEQEARVMSRRTDCYWCSATSTCYDTFCLACRRYSSKPEGTYAPKSKQACNWLYILGDTDDSIVLVTCSNKNCNKQFSLTGIEYQERSAQLRRLAYVHSEQFRSDAKTYWENYKTQGSRPRTKRKSRPAINFADPETQRLMARWEAVLERKYAKRQERANAKLAKKREEIRLEYERLGLSHLWQETS